MDNLVLSPKQKISLKDSDARYNIWVGAVRSGKSFVSIVRFIEFVVAGPPGDFCIIGKSLGAIKRNVIGQMKTLLGDFLHVVYGRNEAIIGDRVIHLIGANDERAEHKIRGSSFAGAYVDEITIIPETVFEMLKSRLSIKGAKLFGTTNPDSPFHWFYKDMLCRDDIDLKMWNFLLDDNPSLDPVFVENLKKEYVGLWYQRFIEGKWVLAEGAIFDFFDEKIHTINSLDLQAQEYIVGIDYGTTNPCAFVLIGINRSAYPHYWVEAEYYWNSREELKQKTDVDYADDLERFTQRYNVKQFYIDPSATSFKTELRKRGVFSVTDADNDILGGIRSISNLITCGDLKIDKTCKKLIQEIQTYSWDRSASNRGIDKPLKQNDHAVDAMRYALYTYLLKNSTDKSMSPEDLRKLQKSYVNPLDSPFTDLMGNPYANYRSF